MADEGPVPGARAAATTRREWHGAWPSTRAGTRLGGRPSRDSVPTPCLASGSVATASPSRSRSQLERPSSRGGRARVGLPDEAPDETATPEGEADRVDREAVSEDATRGPGASGRAAVPDASGRRGPPAPSAP